MSKYIKNIVRDTWVAFPAILLAIYFSAILIGNIIEYFLFPFFGKWSVLISLPISWPYIYSPVLDEIMNFFLKDKE